MATTDVALQEAAAPGAASAIVNDMSIQVATVNGSGSQSSNTVLLRSIFQMGVPVSGKNLFPVEHRRTAHLVHHPRQQGRLHRAQEGDRFPGRHESRDRAGRRDVAGRRARPCCTTSRSNLNELRNDLTFYSVPYDKLVAPVCPEAKLRKLVKNMIYVGVVAKLLDIDMAEVEKAIRKQFAKKVKAANLNLAAVQGGLRLRRRQPDQARSVFHRSA